MRASGLLFIIGFLLFLCGCQQHTPDPVYTDRQRLMLDTTDNHTTNIDSLKRFVIKYQELGDKEREMAAFAELGHSYMSASRYNEAIEAHKEELALAESLQDTLMLATCLNDLGTNYRRISHYYEALESHLRAVEVASPAYGKDRDKLLKCQAVGNNGLGNIYLKLGNYSFATNYLNKALEIEKQLGSNLGMNVDYSNLGMVYEKKEMYDSAMICFEKAFTHAKLCDSKTGIAYGHMNFGRIYKYQKDNKKATEEFLLAMQYINKDIDKWLWLQPCIATADIFVASGDTENAEKHLKMAADVIKTLGSSEYYSQITNLYAEHYKNLGQTEKALEYAQISQHITDSLLSRQNLMELENLRYQMLSRQSERQISSTRLQLAQEKSKKWFYLNCFIVAVIITTLSVLFFRMRTRTFKMQKELNRMRERFFTNITHEFRTPLTIIMGKGQELIDSTIDPNQVKETGKMIVHHGQNMLSLVNQLMDIAKVTSTVASPEWRHGNLVPYLHMIVEEYSHLAQQKHISLLFESKDMNIEADVVPDYIHKIVSNLVVNALKFTPENGQVKLSLSTQDNRIHLSVSDTGIGIAPETQRNVFKVFYQERRDTQHIGTGVGLALVRELVQASGGTISLESELNKGATFHIDLPLTHGNSQYESLESEPLSLVTVPSVEAEHSLSDSTLSTPKQKVLIVEDNADVARFIGETLTKRYSLYYAQNGSDGLRKAEELIPDIILTDLLMPEMDGLEMCKAIRSSQKTSTIPIIIITALTSQDELEKGLRAGANAYIYKPFSGNELRIRVEWILTERRMLQEKYQLAANQVKNMKNGLPGEDLQLISKFTNLVYDQMRDVDINIDVLALEMCMSKSTLRKRISDITGDSLNNYITKIRVDYAQQLLKRSVDLSVGEIALRCGFSDQAYFSRIFKQFTGISPLQYRKNITDL